MACGRAPWSPSAATTAPSSGARARPPPCATTGTSRQQGDGLRGGHPRPGHPALAGRPPRRRGAGGPPRALHGLAADAAGGGRGRPRRGRRGGPGRAGRAAPRRREERGDASLTLLAVEPLHPVGRATPPCGRGSGSWYVPASRRRCGWRRRTWPCDRALKEVPCPVTEISRGPEPERTLSPRRRPCSTTSATTPTSATTWRPRSRSGCGAWSRCWRAGSPR